MSHICIVAGDPSGDAHAAKLVQALGRLAPALTFTGFGGPALQQAGVRLLDQLTHTAAIGPFDAARHLRDLAKIRERLSAHLASERPEAVLLVDFGDFNLPIAAPLAKRAGCRVIYYISPQLWAWGRFRMRWVKRYVDRMLVLFQFEERFYRDAGVAVTWVGHPLIDAVKNPSPRQQVQTELGLNPWRMTVGLLPGSREQEVARHLPLLIAAARHIAWQMPGVQFLLLKAPHISPEYFARLATLRELEILTCENRVSDSLPLMDAAIVTSGTATLEASLFEVPMAVVYRTSLITYLAARTVMRIPHIAMPNVLAGRPIVPEFVQFRARPGRVAQELVRILRSEDRREEMRQALRGIREQLGPPGAIDRAARAVLEELAR